MRFLDEAAVRAALPWDRLIAALRDVFINGCELPPRTIHTVHIPQDPDATLLLMPAWQGGKWIVVKTVTITPGNGARGLPAVAAVVTAFDGRTGALRAILDGGEITARRTAAASALAADALARRDAAHLLIVGAGRIACNLASAHPTVRAYRRISIWARRRDAADTLAATLSGMRVEICVAESLEAAAREADVISCATLAREPLIRGEWLKPGTHLDLAGGYTHDMREADDAAVGRAATIYVDTFDGALAEAGDILQPMQHGVITRDRITGEMADLCRNPGPHRTDDSAITLFKSVGTAIEDYAAVTLALS